MTRVKMTWLLTCTCIGTATIFAPLPAYAEIKMLSCSSTPDGTETFRFKIDYSRSIVIWPQYGAPEETSAQITNETVIWERPRYEPGDGTIIFGARYVLDRYNGQLRADTYCLDRDWDICSPGYASYCRLIDDKPQF